MNEAIQQNTIECPFCSEAIKQTAKKCPHCSEILDVQMRELEALKKEKSSPQVFMNAGGGASSSSSPALRSFRHVLHIILTLITGGLWLPVYLLLYFFRNKNVYH